jgi:hypothetical protein
VSWGYRSEDVLLKAGAKIIVQHPGEFEKIFANM